MKTSDLRLKLNEAMAQAQAWQKHIKIQQDIISERDATIAQLKSENAALRDPDVDDALSIQADLLITTIKAGADWPIDSPIVPPVVIPPVVIPPVVIPPVIPAPTITLAVNVLASTAPGSAQLSPTVSSDVTKVECFRDGVLIFTKPVPPFGYTDTGLPAGTYTYTEKAYGPGGATVSNAVQVVISPAIVIPVQPIDITPL